MRRKHPWFDLLFLLIIIALGAWFLMPRAASFDPEGGPLTIDGISLGMNQDQVLEILGEPDYSDRFGRGSLSLFEDLYYGPGLAGADKAPTFEEYDTRIHLDYSARVEFAWGKQLLQGDRVVLGVGENANRAVSRAWGRPLEIGSPDRTDIRLIPVPLREGDYTATGEMPQYYGLIVRGGLIDQVGLAYPTDGTPFSLK